jgi:diacylglycerol kinase family enzyme
LRGFLIINPRSGQGPGPAELLAAAKARRIETHVYRPGVESLDELARKADADAIGMAGGDGSLAPVASVCVGRDLPFVCVPFGTRNHFARDLGLDRNDPITALAAFDGGEERAIDIGRAGGQLFLNNVSLGVYGRLVHVRERHRRRRDAFARLRALAIVATHPKPAGLTIDGTPVDARIALVANNAYNRIGPLSLGVRERLDEGVLHLYLAKSVLTGGWEERTAERFVIDSRRSELPAAADGEPVALPKPIEFRVEQQALRVLVPARG